jgi:hypothetical protein
LAVGHQAGARIFDRNRLMATHALRTDPQKAELELHQPAGDSDLVSRLDTFPSESETFAERTPAARPAYLPAPATAARRQSGDSRLYLTAAAALGLTIALASLLWWRQPPLSASTGALRVETDTAGADVTIDGTYRGKTPLLVNLAAGEHAMTLTQGTLTRTIPVSIAERTTVVHHLSWPAGAPVAPRTGGIEISTEPRGQNVSVDGQPRGITPVTVTELAPGEHAVIIGRDPATAIRRTVQVEAGTNASLMVSTSRGSGFTTGWLSITVPIPVQVFEGEQFVGSTASDRILVPAGNHTYDFVNDALGFRTSETVRIVPGQTASVAITLPRGTINVNAVPWAQVWLDGQPLGETPIGNVSWPIGTHELVLRHPDLGERRVTATITSGEPARVAVDMRTPQ